MMRALFTAATGMEAQQLRMDVTANNLANASTTGFKRGRAEFEDLLSEEVRTADTSNPQSPSAPSPLEVGLGVKAGSTTRSFSQGDMINTSNPLDVAIGGTGFFRIERANGDYAFTRAGNFRVDTQGKLVTQNGESVSPGITIPTNATNITIGSDGKVSATVPGRTDAQELGQLELATFTNPGGLEALGNNLLTATAASGEAQVVKPGEDGSGSLSQGFLEGSNVKSVEEMIDMITTQRAYELNSKVIQTADQMLQRLTQMR